MKEFQNEISMKQRKEQLPDWVIAHMIRLCEFAESKRLLAFEAKLIDATETLLEGLNENGVVLSGLLAVTMPTSNVVPFTATRHALGLGPQQPCGDAARGR